MVQVPGGTMKRDLKNKILIEMKNLENALERLSIRNDITP